MVNKHFMLFEKFAKSIVAWHGSDQEIETFDLRKLGTGRGHDEEGPGFYFTSEKSDAAMYGKPHKYVLNLKNPVPLKGRVNERQVRQLIKMAPNLKDKLDNWGENEKYAFELAVSSIMDRETPHSAFMQVWYEFYRHDQAEYVTNMKKLGYDGVIVPKTEEVTHYVMFSPLDISKAYNQTFRPKNMDRDPLKRGIIVPPKKMGHIEFLIKFENDDFWHKIKTDPHTFHYSDDIETVSFDVLVHKESSMWNDRIIPENNFVSVRLTIIAKDPIRIKVQPTHLESKVKISFSKEGLEELTEWISQKILWNRYEDKKESGLLNQEEMIKFVSDLMSKKEKLKEELKEEIKKLAF